MAIKRLDINNESDAFVLAISCHQNSLKMAWEISKALNCQLTATQSYDNSIYFVDDISGFPYFNWMDESGRFTLHLISNHSEESLLVPNQKQIDYFFIVTGLYKELDFENGAKKIKAIESVLTAFPITLKNTKK